MNYKGYKFYFGRLGFIKFVWEKNWYFRFFFEREGYWFGYVKFSDVEFKC